MSRWDALRATAWLVRYQLGFANLDEAVRATIESLRGTREDELRGRVDTFYARHIRQLYRPGARSVLAEHRSRGERVVILTSASCYLAEAVARELAFEDVLANRFEVDAEGIYTGKPLGRICYGRGKREVAEDYCGARAVDLSACAFYTDSMADVPLLEVVGRPVAVNPDPRLRRLAIRRGWRIDDWGRPG